MKARLWDVVFYAIAVFVIVYAIKGLTMLISGCCL